MVKLEKLHIQDSTVTEYAAQGAGAPDAN